MAIVEVRDLDGHLLASVDFKDRGFIGLEGRDLRGANLFGVTLSHPGPGPGSGPIGWHLDDADLSGSDLRQSDLRFTSLNRTKLTGCKFDGARLNWCSHDLTSEIFRQAATTSAQLEVAEINLANRRWTYLDFAKLGHPEFEWAMSVLRAFYREGEAYMQPEALKHVLANGGA